MKLYKEVAKRLMYGLKIHFIIKLSNVMIFWVSFCQRLESYHNLSAIYRYSKRSACFGTPCMIKIVFFKIFIFRWGGSFCGFFRVLTINIRIYFFIAEKKNIFILRGAWTKDWPFNFILDVSFIFCYLILF